MAKNKNIFLIGLMGAGKTTIGRQVANELSLEFFDSDHEIENRTGVTITHIFDIEVKRVFVNVKQLCLMS